MPIDCEVFEPNDENLAQLVVRILEEKGYNAGYQLGYPHNKIFIKVDDKEEADRIYNALSQGGTNCVAPHDEFWGYWGVCLDRFGIRWMFNVPNQQYQ